MRPVLAIAGLKYLDALQAGDLETLAALWQRAASDTNLEQLLCDLTEELATEQEPGPGWRADAAKVMELLAQHVPSARRSSEPIVAAGAPLTAGDVAARIAGDESLLSRLGPDERQ